MKRCPRCHRTETDNALVFCRADGTALISDSGAVSADAGTVKFGSAPVVNEIENEHPPASHRCRPEPAHRTDNRASGSINSWHNPRTEQIKTE
ncbi:hypothetical protein BH20ACI3_BH20ACI3_24780 [soil metagenome]